MPFAFAVVVSLSAFFFLACAPSVPIGPAVVANPDAAAPISQDACGLTCWHLRVIGCREGHVTVCEETCAQLVEDDMPPPFFCLSGAKTAEAVRACGSIRCLP